jgi:hypothetical protein
MGRVCYSLMMRNILLVVLGVVAIVVALNMLGGVGADDDGSVTELETNSVASDYKNVMFEIDGEAATTQYFGNELASDLDGDGDEDVAFVVTRETGGSGTFFYAVAALKTDDGYVGSDGYLLGDRIAPQSTNVSPNPRHVNVVVFNYADRLPDEPMTASPSVGKSVYLKIVPETNRWAIVEPDFEGESAL